MLIIFDMGNVVSRSVDVLPPLAEKVGIPEKRLRELYKDDFFGLTIGAISTTRFWELFSHQFGVEVSEDYLGTLFNPEIDPAMAKLLGELRGEGYRVVCGTNTIESHYVIHQQRGDYSLFDEVYASHLMGCAKPDKSFYDYILKAEQSKGNYSGENDSSGKAFFIDDLEDNVNGALGAGLYAHRFTGIEELLSFFAGNRIILPMRT